MLTVFGKDLLCYMPMQLITTLVAFVSIPLFTHILSATQFGQYALVMASVGLIMTLSGWLKIAIMRFYPSMSEQEAAILVRSLLWAQIGMMGLLGVTTFILTRTLWVIDITLQRLIDIGVWICIFQSLFDLLTEILRARLNAGPYSLFVICSKIVGFGSGLLLAVTYRLGVDGLLLGIILGLAVTLPFLWKRALAGVHALGPVSVSLLYELALYGIPLILGEVSVWVIDQSNRYLMELFYSTREVGMYSAAYLISWQPIILLHTLIRLSLGPRLVNVWEKQGENASKRLLNTAVRLYLLVAIPMVAGLSVLAEPIMKAFTGPDFSNGYTIFPWIVCGAFFLGLQQSFNYVLLLLKRPRIVMSCLIISSLLAVALNCCLFPLFSYKIAAVNTFVSYAFLYASLALTSRRYFRWPFPWPTVTRSLLAAGTMFGGIFFFISQANLSPLWTLCLAVPTGILIYGLSLWVLGEISPAELQAIEVGRRRWFDRQAAG